MKKLLTLLLFTPVLFVLSTPAYAGCKYTNTVNIPSVMLHSQRIVNLLVSNRAQRPVIVKVEIFNHGENITDSVMTNGGVAEVGGKDGIMLELSSSMPGNQPVILGGTLTWSSEHCLNKPLRGVVQSVHIWGGNRSSIAVDVHKGNRF